MANTELPREAQLVAFFVTKCAGKRSLGRTQLMKLLYLADYEARRYLGRPISDLEYVWHHFGPYHDRFGAALATLEASHVVHEESMIYPTGQQGYRYSPGESPDVSYGFSPIEIEILRYVCTTYSELKLQALLGDVVYETEPMQAAKERNARGDKLDMDMVNDQKRFAYGIPFEELYSRIQNARAGNVVSHAEAMRLLRVQNVAA